MEEKKGINWKEMYESPLKKYGTKDIEKTISDSLSALAGEEIEVNIENIDYNPYKKEMTPGKSIRFNFIASSPIKSSLK